MIQIPSRFQVVSGADRTHPYLTDILTYSAIFTRTIQIEQWSLYRDLGPIRMACPACDADIILPMHGYVGALINGRHPPVIDVRLEPIGPEGGVITALGITDLSTRVVAAMFALFSAQASEWLKSNHSTSFHKWPPISNFCRVVRNAIVHNGTINIESPNAPRVAWRSLTFDHTNLGQKILGTGILSMGDLIVLLLDLDEELNQLGAPFQLG